MTKQGRAAMGSRWPGQWTRLCSASVLAVACAAPASPPASSGERDRRASGGEATSQAEQRAGTSAQPANIPQGRKCTGALTFEDDDVEYAVRQAVGKPDGEILPPDAQTLDKLVTDAGTLEGIECLTGLRTLVLDCPCMDLGPLSGYPSSRC